MTHTDLFNQIEEELNHGGITGWCEVPKAIELAALIVGTRPKIVVELGVWGGRSLLPMALACEHVQAGVVIGIDPWSPDASTEGYDPVNAEWWSQQDHDRVYNGFMAHVARLGLQHRVAIARAKSADAARPNEINLLHVDAQHCQGAIDDVKRFAPAVPVGGVVCMDDLEWTTGGVAHVKQAVDVLLAMGFIELHRTKTDKGSWGFFQRTSFPLSAPAPNAGATRPRRGAALAASKRRKKK